LHPLFEAGVAYTFVIQSSRSIGPMPHVSFGEKDPAHSPPQRAHGNLAQRYEPIRLASSVFTSLRLAIAHSHGTAPRVRAVSFSRLLIVVILAAVPLVQQIPVSQWQHDDSTVIKLNGSAFVDGLRNVALGNDGAWYLGIARNGYEHRPFSATRQANWAFFPLHPLLWRLMAKITGEWFWSGIVLANLLTLAGWSMLWKLVETLTESTESADDAVLFAAFWPTSYFMTLPQTEPLFFVLVTLTFLSACYRR
jgi:hypothetical protein